MNVTVKLFGTLRRFSDPETPGLWRGEIADGARIRDLIRAIGTSEAEVAAAALDNVNCPLETIIPAGAVVTLVTPMGGG